MARESRPDGPGGADGGRGECEAQRRDEYDRMGREETADGVVSSGVSSAGPQWHPERRPQSAGSGTTESNVWMETLAWRSAAALLAAARKRSLARRGSEVWLRGGRPCPRTDDGFNQVRSRHEGVGDGVSSLARTALGIIATGWTDNGQQVMVLVRSRQRIVSVQDNTAAWSSSCS